MCLGPLEFCAVYDLEDLQEEPIDKHITPSSSLLSKSIGQSIWWIK